MWSYQWSLNWMGTWSFMLDKPPLQIRSSLGAPQVSSTWEHMWPLDLNIQVAPFRNLHQSKIKTWRDYPRIMLVWIQSYSELRKLVLSHSYQQISLMMPLLYKPDRKGREGCDVSVKGCSLNVCMYQQRTEHCTNRRNINMNFSNNNNKPCEASFAVLCKQNFSERLVV